MREDTGPRRVLGGADVSGDDDDAGPSGSDSGSERLPVRTTTRARRPGSAGLDPADDLGVEKIEITPAGKSMEAPDASVEAARSR